MLRYKRGVSGSVSLSFLLALAYIFSSLMAALIALISARLVYLIPTLIPTKPFTIIVGPIFTVISTSFKAPRTYYSIQCQSVRLERKIITPAKAL